MRSLAYFVLVAGFLGVASLSLSAVQAADGTPKQNQDQWRYTFHNGEWWYWLPANQWVYWRDNRWNDYKPQTYTSPRAAGIVVTIPDQSDFSNDVIDDSDIGPFYGRTIGGLDSRTLETNGEVGPFYGRALPNEIFNVQPSRRTTGPFYGRAPSSRDAR